MNGPQLLAPDLPQNAVPLLPLELVIERAERNAQAQALTYRAGNEGLMVANYVRHCLTCYDSARAGMPPLDYLRLKKRVLQEIAQVYPQAARACHRETRGIDARIREEELRQSQRAHRLILSA